MEPVLIERINAFFGYGAVARLALVQGPPLNAKPAPPRLRKLSVEEQRAIDARVAQSRTPSYARRCRESSVRQWQETGGIEPLLASL